MPRTDCLRRSFERGLTKPYAAAHHPAFLFVCLCKQACNDAKQKSLSRFHRERLCAQDWIRTSTSLRTLRPEHSASTNFATWAEEKIESGKLKIENEQPKAINSLSFFYYPFSVSLFRAANIGKDPKKETGILKIRSKYSGFRSNEVYLLVLPDNCGKIRFR